MVSLGLFLLVELCVGGLAGIFLVVEMVVWNALITLLAIAWEVAVGREDLDQYCWIYSIINVHGPR